MWVNTVHMWRGYDEANNEIILVVGKYHHNGQEWDTNQSGSISVDQMSEIYRIYKEVDFCMNKDIDIWIENV